MQALALIGVIIGVWFLYVVSKNLVDNKLETYTPKKTVRVVWAALVSCFPPTVATIVLPYIGVPVAHNVLFFSSFFSSCCIFPVLIAKEHIRPSWIRVCFAFALFGGYSILLGQYITDFAGTKEATYGHIAGLGLNALLFVVINIALFDFTTKNVQKKEDKDVTHAHIIPTYKEWLLVARDVLIISALSLLITVVGVYLGNSWGWRENQIAMLIAAATTLPDAFVAYEFAQKDDVEVGLGNSSLANLFHLVVTAILFCSEKASTGYVKLTDTPAEALRLLSSFYLFWITLLISLEFIESKLSKKGVTILERCIIIVPLGLFLLVFLVV